MCGCESSLQTATWSDIDGEESRAYMTATQGSVSMAELNLGPDPQMIYLWQ